MKPAYPDSRKNDYSPDDDRARLDRLCADVADAEDRIAALQPELVDWERYYTDLFTDLAARADRWKGVG